MSKQKKRDNITTQEFLYLWNHNQHLPKWEDFYEAMKAGYEKLNVKTDKLPTERQINLRCHRCNIKVEEATGRRFFHPEKPPAKSSWSIADIMKNDARLKPVIDTKKSTK